MTTDQKLDAIEENPTKVHFFKEGCFYKLYNQNLFWFCKEIKPLKVLYRHIKKGNHEVLSGGFPFSALSLLKEKYPACFGQAKETGYGFSVESAADLEGYFPWLEESIAIGKAGIPESVEARLKKFPLEKKTPMEAFLFLKEMQESIRQAH